MFRSEQGIILSLSSTHHDKKNNSERPVDALAVKKRDPLTDNLKSRDARASKKSGLTNMKLTVLTVFTENMKKYDLITDNLKSRDASAFKNQIGLIRKTNSEFYLSSGFSLGHFNQVRTCFH